LPIAKELAHNFEFDKLSQTSEFGFGRRWGILSSDHNAGIVYKKHVVMDAFYASCPT
jgi:hypothetical protein